MSSLPQSVACADPSARSWGRGRRLALLGGLALLCLLAFMTVGVRTDWAFVLEHRGAKVLTMALVACAIGLSTVVIERADGVQVPSRFAELRGIAGPGPTTDELMALLRGEPE